MGKRQDKRRRNRQQTTEEIDFVKEKEMERAERADAERRARLLADAERRARLSPKHFARAGGDPPPILGEPDALVRTPLKPKPHLRSGAIALPEPEPEEAVLTVSPKSITK